MSTNSVSRSSGRQAASALSTMATALAGSASIMPSNSDSCSSLKLPGAATISDSGAPTLCQSPRSCANAMSPWCRARRWLAASGAWFRWHQYWL